MISDNVLPIFLDNITLQDGPISCTETSVTNYHYSLLNNPEERSSHVYRRTNLKSRTMIFPSHSIQLVVFANIRHFLTEECCFVWVLFMKSCDYSF